MTPAVAQPFKLTLPLNPFSRHGESERFTEGQYCRCDGGVGYGLIDILYEGLVDLDLVGWEACDVRKGRIAGTEIIESYNAAESPQTIQRVAHARRLADQERLGNLNLDQRRWNADRSRLMFEDTCGIPMQ